MRRDPLALVFGPVLGAGIGLAAYAGGLSFEAAVTAGVTALCAAWWVLEPIHIAATSLIPFAVFPLAGVVGHREVAASYGHTLILLLLGGFMLSAAVEKSGAHRRIALGMVRLTGGRDRRLILGFMLASALCSMWISNTATTLMLLPVALAAIEGRDRSIEVPLLLGIAYAASIGGVATPVGTPPNIIFMGIYQQNTGEEISFLSWMTVGVPVVVLMLPIAWLYLTRKLGGETGGGAPRATALVVPGPMTPAERRVLIVFGITAAAWVFRGAPGGGWSALLGVKETAGDATVALAAVVALFLVGDGAGSRLLDWKTAERIPWGLLILFGGGIAIAGAFESSGLSAAIGAGLQRLAELPAVLMIAAIALAVTFLTEVTSNTATTTLLMPVLAAAGIAAGLAPEMLMVPAALSASCAFMLPVATAPNAIMFGTGKVSTAVMAREGFGLNLAGAVVITVICTALVPYL
jgi:sodium-dependent dicarboxylate transporter 2/3/5